jgi:hypothetical protein
MTVVCEITCAAAHTSASAQRIFCAGAARRWASLPDLVSLDLYTPAIGRGHDPYIEHEQPPAILAMLAFRNFEGLECAAQSPVFADGVSLLPPGAVTCTAMTYEFFPVAGEKSPAPLTAYFSYVVRYFRPAEDEVLFVKSYIEGHPPILGKLPGIRNVMCYVPLAWRHPEVPAADYLLGNEVAFDDIDAFNAAMASPVRDELRAHFKEFPKFSGKNTHFAMDRIRLVG